MLLCAFIIPRWTWRPMFVAIGVIAVFGPETSRKSVG